MTKPFLEDELVQGPHPDGTYTIPDPDGYDWTLRDTGQGWTSTSPTDDYDGIRWATAEDAAHAVLDYWYPSPPRKWGE